VFVASQVRSLIAVVFAFSLFATACGGGGTSASSDSDTSSPATTSPDSDTTDDARVDESADGSDAVTAADETVEVAQGGTLRIGMQNEASSLNPTNSGIKGLSRRSAHVARVQARVRGNQRRREG